MESGTARRALAAFAALTVAWSPGSGAEARPPAAKSSATELAVRAARLHRDAIVVDTHEDVPEQLLQKWADLGLPGATEHVDIPRLQKGGVTAAFFSIFVSPASGRAGTATKEALEVSDVVDRIVELPIRTA